MVKSAAYLLLLLVLGVAAHIHSKTWVADTAGQDVYYAWVEGERILEGVNPYARILQGNMLDNDKYATYFPLFYLLSSLTQAAGLHTYADWIAFWRYVFLLFHLGIGTLIFLIYGQKQQWLLALAAAALWLFNNWALTVSTIAHIDYIPLFFLILSLYLFERRQVLSLFCFGLSLALKQIAIFLLPLYLIWLWQAARGEPVRETIRGALLITALPALFSLPFLLWGPEAYVRSILFSITRHGYSPYTAGTLLAGSGGVISRAPLFLLLAAVYLLTWQKRPGRYLSAMLVMLVFTGISPVLFPQYMVWLIALVILTPYDALPPFQARPQPAL
jgi:uncharacterized membrane protein